ncbi:MAG: response regulator [Verrucomicrobiota bacterium]
MTGKARILVVEGETPVAMMMVNVLTQAGCDVLAASSGEKGIELAQEAKFDLIVLDTDLPHGNGFEVCSELKQRHLTRHVPIIFIGGRLHEEDRHRAIELGAVDYIEKPFGASEFISRILSYVGPAQTRHKPSPLDVSDESADADAKGFRNAAQGNQ